MSFSIYSDKSLAATTCTITNEVYETLHPTTEYRDDAALLAGKTVTDSSAHTGYKVKVYKTVFTDGKQVSKEAITDDYYKVMNAVVRRGTKVEQPAPVVPDPNLAAPPAAPAAPAVTPPVPATPAAPAETPGTL
ncbi:MAG TPA: G5 domain-containing protein [Clostridiaceae bacterium]|nr:G5 domain-containing protein [Clostridiaceae bacterium]